MFVYFLILLSFFFFFLSSPLFNKIGSYRLIQALLEEEGKLKPPTEVPDSTPAPKRLKKGEGNKRIYNDEVAFELSVDEKYVIIHLMRLRMKTLIIFV